ncbi:response regulator [Candidatus Woesearchaeota archaeon]|nr:response regulator [Candidatus Woesearchaeota archaeon]
MARILFCDDDENTRHVFTEMCTELGQLCDVAETDDEAMVFARRMKHDLVIIDLGNVHCDTYDLCREIRGLLPFSVIILTSGYMQEYRREVIEQLPEKTFNGLIAKSELVKIYPHWRSGLSNLLQKYGLT